VHRGDFSQRVISYIKPGFLGINGKPSRTKEATMTYQIQHTSMAMDALAAAFPAEIENAIERIEPEIKIRLIAQSPSSSGLNSILQKIARGQIALGSTGEDELESFEERCAEALRQVDGLDSEKQVQLRGFLIRRFSGEGLVSALIGGKELSYMTWKAAFGFLLRNGSIYLDMLNATSNVGSIRLSDSDRLRLRARIISATAGQFIVRRGSAQPYSRYQAAFYLLTGSSTLEAKAVTWLRRNPRKQRPLSWWTCKHPELLEFSAGGWLIERGDVLTALTGGRSRLDRSQ
jgi:hypothetical protein